MCLYRRILYGATWGHYILNLRGEKRFCGSDNGFVSNCKAVCSCTYFIHDPLKGNRDKGRKFNNSAQCSYIAAAL